MGKSSKVLALDIALNHWGFSLWDGKVLKNYGSEKFKIDSDDEVSDKMNKMFRKIYSLVSFTQPDMILTEAMFLGFNAASFAKLSQLNGIIIAIANLFNIKYKLVNIRKYRSFLGIKDKKHVFSYVSKFLDIDNDDQSDAVALGLYGVQQGYDISEVNKEFVNDIKYKEEFEEISKSFKTGTIKI